MGATTQPDGTLCGFLGCIDPQVGPVSGVVYYLSAPGELVAQAITGTLVSSEVVRAITYSLFLMGAATLFSVFWVVTSGMGAEDVAEQLTGMGLQIPGFRSDKKVMKVHFKRYIPYLAVLSGLLIGAIAAFADITGAVGGGTGILLLTMIVYGLYEQLKREPPEEIPPILRKFIGE
jgi:preprotein translocase subunit SecY